MIIKRKKTKVITLGNLKIGGGNPIAVQSMLKSKLEETGKIKEEVKKLVESGCDVIRVAVPEKRSIGYLKSLIEEKVFPVPVVADIQFDWSLAIDCLDLGVDCVRINPGNIGGKDKLAKIAEKARQKKAALRIGVNSGSIDKEIFKRNKGNIVNSMVESVIECVKIFEDCEFYNFKISAKASSVLDTINVYEILSDKLCYPLHLGITEAGPPFRGGIKSAVGLGILLSRGIGDTIRVSLTGRAIDEVKAAYIILGSLNLRKRGVDIISCPTCGRTVVDLKKIVDMVEDLTYNVKKELKVAIMGCIVNGPGEARDADIGIAMGKEKAAIFIKGKVIDRVDRDEMEKRFKEELERMLED
ncbi:MAG: flavodoxin-dependent (E)-4-hydroxy-3-methylbut-2-enyl-diphosphate synthase [Actinobacteria bacterium]|nr:flavodoxin-dependent (E)-4-hydroxy-3-methylbut-2-enyl-diphosphate synthase [Actinomycetota bacterium]